MKISPSAATLEPGAPPDRSVPSHDRVEPSDAELRIDPAQVARTLAVLVALLVLASLVGQALRLEGGYEYAGGFVPKFHLDAENNVPTFFSALLLVAAAALLGVVAAIKRKASRPYAGHWGILAFLFLFLAFDEASAIHEALIMPLRTIFKSGGIFHYAWVIAAIPLVILFVVAFAKFFFHLPKRSRLHLGLAVGIYIGGALGLELLGGAYAARFGLDNWGYVLLTTIEEALEMTGVVILIYGLLDFLKNQVGNIRCLWPSTP